MRPCTKTLIAFLLPILLKITSNRVNYSKLSGLEIEKYEKIINFQFLICN